MTRRLMEGSEAIAEAMVAAGCRFFAGYPMTPFTEVLEHMARLLPAVGGTCMNAESEIEAVGMAWGAAATGTRAATGSVGQGLSLMQESLSEICFARLPLVVLNMARGQGDYFQATRGGGHGDYRHIVVAPSDVPEAVPLTTRLRVVSVEHVVVGQRPEGNDRVGQCGSAEQRRRGKPELRVEPEHLAVADEPRSGDDPFGLEEVQAAGRRRRRRRPMMTRPERPSRRVTRRKTVCRRSSWAGQYTSRPAGCAGDATSPRLRASRRTAASASAPA